MHDFGIAPNPARDYIKVQFKAPAGDFALRLIDTTGKTYFSENILKTTGFYKTEIDLSQAPTGMLILVVVHDGKEFTKKIMKQ